MAPASSGIKLTVIAFNVTRDGWIKVNCLEWRTDRTDDEENATRPIGFVATIQFEGKLQPIGYWLLQPRAITRFIQILYLKYDHPPSHPTPSQHNQTYQLQQRGLVNISIKKVYVYVHSVTLLTVFAPTLIVRAPKTTINSFHLCTFYRFMKKQRNVTNQLMDIIIN